MTTRDHPIRAEGADSAELIDRLAADLEPVRPARPGRLFALCLAVQLGAISGFLALVGRRPDLSERLVEPAFFGVLVLLAVAAAWSGSIAIRLAVPGRAVSERAGWLLPVVPLALAGLVLILNPFSPTWPGLASAASGCLRCAGLTAAAAAVPWLVVLAVVSRLAPLNELRIGMFAGLSAFLIGAIVTELHCPSSSGYHLAFGHYLPVVLFSALACVVAAAVIRVRPGLR